MSYVVAYDISDDADRDRVAQVLSGYGHRVQYSVFELDIDAKTLVDVVSDLEPYVAGVVDSVRIYRRCAACATSSHVLGRGARSDLAPGGGEAWIV